MALTSWTNLAIDSLDSIDLDALMPTNEDLYLTGYTFQVYDSVDFMRDLRAGLLIREFDSTGGTLYYRYSKHLTPPTFYHTTLTRYYVFYAERFNPIIKIPYNTTSAVLELHNFTQEILDHGEIYVTYFTLPYAT